MMRKKIKSIHAPGLSYQNKDLSITIGNFDGLHLGHIELINTSIYKARNSNCYSSVITFSPHPSTLLKQNTKMIIREDDKYQMLFSMGIDKIYIIQFDHDVMSLSYESFLSQLTDILPIQFITTGYNFKFGANKLGDIKQLRKLSNKFRYNYQFIGPITWNHHILSSSYIRLMLASGAVGIVSKMLSRPYTISGRVVKGNGKARHLLVPTANIVLSDNICYPAKGVYLVRVTIDQEKINFFGIANIGYRPTLVKTKELVAEVHLFHFNGNLYDRFLTIYPLQFIRPERQFCHVDLLRKQINKDIANGLYVQKKCFENKN